LIIINTQFDIIGFGDSGGPLVREVTLSDGRKYLEQVGIMSGTVDCSFTKPRPDIYANVRELSAWILNKIRALS
jgi:secreted trypsin-like serine protease